MVVDFYASAIESIVCAAQKLDIIYSFYPPMSNSWPFQVPDWSRKTSPNNPKDRGLLTDGFISTHVSTHRAIANHRNFKKQDYVNSIYAASGDFAPYSSFRTNPKTLTVGGSYGIVSQKCGL